MSPPRPGLAKVRAIPLCATRRTVLVRLAPSRVDEILAAADVVSEGSEVVEGKRGRRTYYGSTSFVLALEIGDGAQDRDLLAALLGDVHLRLLTVRRARLEAAARASGPVGTARAELTVRRVGTPAAGAARGSVELVVDLEITLARAVRARG